MSDTKKTEKKEPGLIDQIIATERKKSVMLDDRIRELHLMLADHVKALGKTVNKDEKLVLERSINEIRADLADLYKERGKLSNKIRDYEVTKVTNGFLEDCPGVKEEILQAEKGEEKISDAETTDSRKARIEDIRQEIDRYNSALNLAIQNMTEKEQEYKKATLIVAHLNEKIDYLTRLVNLLSA